MAELIRIALKYTCLYPVFPTFGEFVCVPPVGTCLWVVCNDDEVRRAGSRSV